MKLLPRTDKHLAFELDELETQLLTLTLSAYPMAHEPWSHPPSSSHKTNLRPPAGSPDPELLASTLGEVKAAHLSRLETFLSGDGIRQHPEGGSQLFLPLEDVEWFMQVVNELRVASWYRLDCPDEKLESLLAKHPEHLHDLLRLDFAGMMLDGILRALGLDSE